MSLLGKVNGEVDKTTSQPITVVEDTETCNFEKEIAGNFNSVFYRDPNGNTQPAWVCKSCEQKFAYNAMRQHTCR